MIILANEGTDEGVNFLLFLSVIRSNLKICLRFERENDMCFQMLINTNY